MAESARDIRRGSSAKSIAGEIRKAQLSLVFEATPQTQLVTVANGLLLYIFLAPVIDASARLGWLAMLAAIVGLRLEIYRRFRRCPNIAVNLWHWAGLSIIGAVLAGLLWGSTSWYLFASDNLAYQAFLAFAVGGMVAGAVTTLSVHLPAATLFVTLSVAPFIYRFGTTPHELGPAMAAMIGLFMVMMLFASLRFSRNFRDTLAESLRREAAEKELAQIAYYDPLTGLPNRRVFADHMKQATAAAKRQGNLIAVCYLDLDDFKPFNDRYGHDTGDQILVAAAEALKTASRDQDIVARWGGDEFAVLLTALPDVGACETTVKRLIAALAVPLDINGITVDLRASMGAAIGQGDNQDPDTLLRQADQAMHLAKQQGRNGYHIFDPARDGADRRSVAVRAEIDSAIENNELMLYFQPKVELGTGTVYGAEALLRWCHPERGLISPRAFLPTWEADERMRSVDEWVLRNAIAQLNIWLGEGLDIVMSVNVSTWLLDDPAFIDRLEELFVEYPRTRGALEIEVTETRALDDISRISELMSHCRDLDVSFALDDFGTGFSSLVHLQRLPAQTLKIDTSFVIAMLENEHDRNLVRGIIGLGQALGKSVVAEGVETNAHGEALLEFGCTLVQGYGVAKPMPGIEFPHWAAHYVTPTTWRTRGHTHALVADAAAS